MKTRYLVVALALVLAAGAVTAVAAYSQAGGAHGIMGHRMGWIARKLDLSDTQKSQVQAIIQAEQPNFAPLVKQLAANHQQMLVATRGGNYDETQVRALATQQAQTLADLMVIRERVISKVYNNVLTADQKTKADTLRQQMFEHMSQRFQQLSNQPTTSNSQ